MAKPHYRVSHDGRFTPAVRTSDGFQNIVANLGTARDKAAANGYILDLLDYQRLSTAYRVSSVAKAIVDAPADDGCREWREWQADEGQISAIEAEEARLGLVAKIRDARKRARLHGGAAIFIGTGDADLAEPLDPQSVQAGGIQYLTVMDRWEVVAGNLERDPRKPGFNRPQYYSLYAEMGGGEVIHPSRLITFTGAEPLDSIAISSQQGWGDSVLQSAMDRVSHLDATVANVASLVFEAKVDVVRIKDFTQGLRTGGSEYEQLMLKRFALAMTGKGINGTLMLDAEEEYDQKSASFATLPDIIDRFMQLVSGAARIPMTRLFGMSPGGLNSTGDSDLRNYYDSVKQEQTLEIGPAMHLFDECLIRSALGERPEEIHYNWRPLWQMDMKDRADVASKLATAADTIIRSEAAPVEAVGKSLVNALTESGAFPGLDQAVDGYFEGGSDD